MSIFSLNVPPQVPPQPVIVLALNFAGYLWSHVSKPGDLRNCLQCETRKKYTCIIHRFYFKFIKYDPALSKLLL